jgi:uncharacterized protein YabE (DUF348 family)
MKLRRSKIAEHYQTIQDSGKGHIYRRPYLIPIFGLLLGGVIVAAAILTHGDTVFRPNLSHVVFLTDDGTQETLDTKAATVGALLAKLPLNLIPQDVIEPSPNTPIFDDNFRINIYRARPVTVVDGNTKIVTLTAQKSARQVAEDAGLKINPEDLATFAQGNLAENIIGEQVIVSPATPVTLNLYGSQVPTYTQAKTVGGLLEEKGIKLENGETVSPGIKTAITPNLLIFILAKDTQVATNEATVPAPVQNQADPSLSFGTSAVIQSGAAGKEINTYLITNSHSSSPGRSLIQQVVIQNPVPEIIDVGTNVDIDSAKTKLMSAAGIPSYDFQYVDYILSRESGWCPTKLQGDIGYCPANPPADIPDYLGYGLGQATPGDKMSANGGDWETNPVTQLEWCNGYAQARYGSWSAAYDHWANYGNW